MQGMRLDPARSLLLNFTYAELIRLARQSRLEADIPRSRAALVNLLTRHLSIDDLAESLCRLFPPPRGNRRAPAVCRLDLEPPGHGEATVQAYSRSRPERGHLLLERGERALVLEFESTPLFLENRWPVIALDAGGVARTRLFAAFAKPGRIHPSAETPPPRTRPFLLDEGEYQLRNRRLRLELSRAGAISFSLTLLRLGRRTRRPEYLLEPIV